jgi:hypothetical protein
MRLRMRLLAALALAALLPMPALADCKTRPKPVRDYMKTRASWVVVTEGHLSDADRAMWKREHKTACPGIAVVDLEGNGQKSYALAVLNRVKDVRYERLVLLQASGKKLLPKTLVAAFPQGDPIVVWRSRAKAVRAFGSRQRIALPAESIRFEKLGMSSKVFYLENGKIETVLVEN